MIKPITAEERVLLLAFCFSTSPALMIMPTVDAEAWLTVRVLLTRKVESNVELAFTNIPAEEDVGVKTLVKSNSQAPGEPVLVHPAPVPVTVPFVSAVRHWVEPVMPEIARLVLVAPPATVKLLDI